MTSLAVLPEPAVSVAPTTRPALGRVVGSAISARPDPSWVEATSTISRQRDMVEAFLAEGTGRAYGFTTLLGPQDHQGLTPGAQGRLLRSHLVAPTSPAAPGLPELMLACKAEQLHHGASGIHPDTYQLVLDAVAAPPGGQWVGNWEGSYSCADVVPGAWVVHNLLGSGRQVLAHPGDLIALISGSFVSTAAALRSTIELVDRAAGMLAAWLPRSADPGGVLPGLVPGMKGVNMDEGAPQVPVSLRDARPVVSALEHTLDQLGAAIEGRLSYPSGNPLWVFDDGRARPVSQSSLLDFRASLALVGAIEVAGLMGGLWQRLIEHTSNSLARQHPRRAPVQPPKVAQSIVDRMGARSGGPGRYAGSDSQGLEDLRDLTLHRAADLEDQLKLVGDLEQVWCQLATNFDLAGPAHRTQLADRLFAQVVGPGLVFGRVRRLREPCGAVLAA